MKQNMGLHPLIEFLCGCTDSGPVLDFWWSCTEIAFLGVLSVAPAQRLLVTSGDLGGLVGTLYLPLLPCESRTDPSYSQVRQSSVFTILEFLILILWKIFDYIFDTMGENCLKIKQNKIVTVSKLYFWP